MSSVSSLSGMQAASQQSLQQLKVQQALRTADQAEQNARSLRAQAGDAQRSADIAQENARSLTVQSDQASSNAGRARQGLAVLKSVSETGTRLSVAYEKVAQLVQETKVPQNAVSTPQAAVTVTNPSSPVVNTQGQTTGKIVNTTA